MSKATSAPKSAAQFDVWGCRGSRNLVPRRSRIGNNTSCYSVLDGSDLFVFDAGRGLAALSHALRAQPRFGAVERVHVLVTHAHTDHWEGLKDADWFWQRRNGLRVRLYGTSEALDGIATGYGHPLYVPLDLLAMGTVERLEYTTLAGGQTRTIGGAKLRTAPLNHYSGQGAGRRFLDTLGFRLTLPGGPTVAYLSDHEPNESTARVEERLLEGTHLAVYDSHFPDIAQQTHGHGSQEHSARMARRHPGLLVLAGHHAPSLSDDQIRAAARRHGRGLKNFHVAVEGRTYAWNARAGGFALRRSS